jgi:methionyl-tRNA formyltransferase
VKLVFMGTPSFAVPTLEAIFKAGHEVSAVFTQPDRPKGRGQRESMPPVKEAALRLALPVSQPERVRNPEVIAKLAVMAPEAIVVVGYGQLIPQAILDIPPSGIINVHASLLPRYRGAAPIQWAIANGESITGVTTMKINAGLDTGDMLLKWETSIEPDETSPELGTRLADAGAQLLIETLAQLDTIRPEPQDNSRATWAPVIKKEDGHIRWSGPARQIVNRMRAFTPWPGCYGFLRDQRFHIWKASVTQHVLRPASLLVENRRLFAGCGEGALEILELQLEGKKRMETAAFLNGFSVASGETLA